MNIRFSWWLPLPFIAVAIVAGMMSWRHLALPAPAPRNPQKPLVVSLSPSVTEMIFILGCGDQLIGRSSACDYPEEAKKLPSVGGFGIPSLERIAALRPRYVFATAAKDHTLKESLAKLGIDYVLLPSQRLDDYDSCIRTLGDRLGCPDRAEAELVRFHQAVDPFKAQAAAVPLETRPKVYFEIWNRPLKTCGGGSLVSDLIECAGGNNIGKSFSKDYSSCSEEWVIASNPAVIICPAMGSGSTGEVLSRPGWNVIAAVKSGRIHSGLDQSLIYRLGPRTPIGIGILHRCIHGEAPAPTTPRPQEAP